MHNQAAEANPFLPQTEIGSSCDLYLFIYLFINERRSCYFEVLLNLK